MTKKWLASACLAFSCLEATASLNNLLEYDKKTCLETLEKASDEQLWDVYLKGQAELFFDSECSWIQKNSWWQDAQNVLEIGCGNGAYLYLLSRQFQEKRFQGIEKLSQLVKQSNIQYIGSNLIFQEGDAEVFADPLNESTNIVLFRFTLQHLNDSTAALKNAARYLVPNGYVVIIDTCDKAQRTTHAISAIDEAFQRVAEVQKEQGKETRRVTFELMQNLANGTSELSPLYEVAFSNFDTQGKIVGDTISFEGEENRVRYFKHGLLFLTLIHRTYHVPVNLEKAYDELKDYIDDNHAWTSPGIHFLVLKKK